jgi:hypothetical protein
VEDLAEKDTKLTLQALAIVTLPYFIVVGLSYLWGYWSIFDINILQYAGISDVAASAAFPVVVGVAFLFVGYISGQSFAQRTHDRVADALPEPTAVRRFVKKYSGPILSLYTVLVMLFMVKAESVKWMIFPFFVAAPTAIVIVEKGWLNIEGLSMARQAALWFAIVFFPFCGFGSGKLDGDRILSGRSFMYVQSSKAGLELSSDPDPKKAPRFLGHAGDFDFFFDPSNNTVSVSKTQDESVLTLKNYTAPVPELESIWDRLLGFLDRLWKFQSRGLGT